MADFWLKTGDLKPSLTSTLVDATDTPVDLTGATVEFVMRLIDGDVTITGAATVTDPAGQVLYEWQPGDTDVPGGYSSEFIVTFVGGAQGSFPNQTWDRIAILERLEDQVSSASMLLASVERYAETNGIQFDPADLQVIRALEDASAFVRNYTGRSFDLVENDEVLLDGTGRDAILLPQLPALAVTAVTVTDQWCDNVDVLETTDWVLDSAGMLWRKGWLHWPYGHANIDVVYDHGYATVPEDIQAAVVALAYATVTAGGASGPVEQEQLLNYSVTYASRTAAGGSTDGPSVRSILDRYRAFGLTREPMVPAGS